MSTPNLFLGWDFTPKDVEQDEIIATGELYKLGGSKGGRRTWSLRKFILTNIFMVYYTKTGEKRGQWNLDGCKVKRVTPEEVNMPAAKHAFAMYGPGKYYVCCASSEKNCTAWMTVITDQIKEFSDEIRRFVKTGESVITCQTVKRKNIIGLSSKVRLVITNFPRMMVITPDLRIKEQIIWEKALPPTFTMVSAIVP
jgi:hypothetical protein